MSDKKVVRAYLDQAFDDLTAAKLLLDGKNRNAVMHLERCVEKITKAVRLSEGLPASKEHDIGELVDGGLRVTTGLSSANVWRGRIKSLDWLSAYATTFGYPSPTGARQPPPDEAKLAACYLEVRQLLDDVRAGLG